MIAGRSRARPVPTTIETSAVVTCVALRPSRSSTICWRRLAGMCGSVERVAQLVGALEDAGEAEQLVLDLVERALGLRDVEQRLGVGCDPVDWLRRRDDHSVAVAVSGLSSARLEPTWLM